MLVLNSELIGWVSAIWTVEKREEITWERYTMPLAVATVVGVLMTIVRLADGRARLLEPPMRSSYWREGIQTAPVNFDDELLNCGGFDVSAINNMLIIIII